MIGIYRIRNTVNGMQYIGQSIDIARRWGEEKSRKQVNPHLRSAFDKYGLEAFSFEVLCECAPGELSELEQLMILETESYIKTKGYNKTFGGEGGRWTDEQKRKRSKMLRGAGNPFYGRKHTDAMKRKMSENRSGEKSFNFGKKHRAGTLKKMSERATGAGNPRARKIHQYTLSGEYIQSFPTAIVAARELGLSRGGILNAATGWTKSSGGFIWSYRIK